MLDDFDDTAIATLDIFRASQENSERDGKTLQSNKDQVGLCNLVSSWFSPRALVSEDAIENLPDPTLPLLSETAELIWSVYFWLIRFKHLNDSLDILVKAEHDGTAN